LRRVKRDDWARFVLCALPPDGPDVILPACGHSVNLRHAKKKSKTGFSMASFIFRIGLVGIGLAVGVLLTMVLGEAQPPENIEQARIDAAIDAYASAQQAEREAASDASVANSASDLLRDPDTPVLGNPDGDVSLISFFDYTCVFCKAAEPRVRQLLENDDGVRLVLKDFPILTPESLTASKAALASARQGLYENYHNALMDFRGQLSEARIFEIAQEVGLDVDRLRDDMESPEIAEHIIANFNLARALRVFSTPTFIVNDRMIHQPSAEIDFPARIAAARID
jgi:protein-disulfide isomerase